MAAVMQAVGFHGFQQTIEAIVEALGEPSLQPAVAHHAIQCLELEVRGIRRLTSWTSLDWGTWWTTATTEEFDAASSRTEATLLLERSGLTRPAIAEAPWRGTMIRLRPGVLQAEGGGYKIQAARFFEGSPTYDYRKRASVTKWQISMIDDFLRCTGHYIGSTIPKTTHASTEAGATKAMRRMAKGFLGIELSEL